MSVAWRSRTAIIGVLIITLTAVHPNPPVTLADPSPPSVSTPISVIDLRAQTGWRDSNPRSISYSPNGRLLAVCVVSGCELYDARSLQLVWFDETVADDRVFPDVQTVVFSPDSSILAGVFYDGSVSLWNATDGTVVRVLPGMWSKRSYSVIAFSSDGSRLAIGGEQSGDVYLVRVADGALLWTLQGGNRAPVRSLMFSQDGATLTAADAGETSDVQVAKPMHLSVWRIMDGTLLQTIEGPRFVNRMALASNCTALVMSSAGNSLDVWNVTATGISLEKHLSESGYRGDSSKPKFTADDAIFAIGRPSRQIEVWRISDGVLLQVFTLEVVTLQNVNNTTRDVGDLAISPDGKTVVSLSYDGLLRFWSVDAIS